MRVLQIGKFFPPHTGGIETCISDLCAGLREFHDVRVLVANEGIVTRRETVDGVAITRLGTLVNISGAPVCPAMVSEIRAARPDLIHLHLPNPTAVLAYAASGVRAPTVVTWHSDIVRQKLLGRLFRSIQSLLLARCAAVIATSANYVNSSAQLAAYRDRCVVVPYGIRLQEFTRADPAKVCALRDRFGDRIVLAVGRLVYYKGFEFLIRAMRLIDAKLLLIGDGPLRGALDREAAAAGVRDRVEFLGNIDNSKLAPYYHAADVFVLPSVVRSEAFGIVQIEAMAAGTPVVNTAIDSGVPYVSLDGLSGLTVPPADTAALARAINRLLDDPELRARMGAAGRRRAHEEFSRETMARRTLELYDDVLYGPSSRGRLRA